MDIVIERNKNPKQVPNPAELGFGTVLRIIC